VELARLSTEQFAGAKISGRMCFDFVALGPKPKETKKRITIKQQRKFNLVEDLGLSDGLPNGSGVTPLQRPKVDGSGRTGGEPVQGARIAIFRHVNP
jgi:hypothetical protein